MLNLSNSRQFWRESFRTIMGFFLFATATNMMNHTDKWIDIVHKHAQHTASRETIVFKVIRVFRWQTDCSVFYLAVFVLLLCFKFIHISVLISNSNHSAGKHTTPISYLSE